MVYEKNIWHNPAMNRIENALELAFKEIDDLKNELKNLKAEKSEEKAVKKMKK